MVGFCSFVFLVFLICTWILTFYGLKSTDSNPVCSSFVGNYGCATHDGKQTLADPPIKSPFGVAFTQIWSC